MRDLCSYDEMILDCAKLNGCFGSWMKPEYTLSHIWVFGRDVSIEVKEFGHYYDTWYHTVTDEELFQFLFSKIAKLEAAQ